ncbi:uncharacterized protein BXZ73DRAFT_75059 [Epithele typhae]|uniref:uncharacterized protein n=1 Tax=Epithele typhae TaxID=378194 RepID=UPI002008204D|nr:uncharacterized protein BXZ73DRAFT_75059 [Epithele typhae]KAH9941896.1 hypothetical protein BXZ73DRAFT_75059 [Epithele typhae]
MLPPALASVILPPRPLYSCGPAQLRCGSRPWYHAHSPTRWFTLYYRRRSRKTGISSEEWTAIKYDVRALTRVAGLNFCDDFRHHDKQKLEWIRREWKDNTLTGYSPAPSSPGLREPVAGDDNGGNVHVRREENCAQGGTLSRGFGGRAAVGLAKSSSGPYQILRESMTTSAEPQASSHTFDQIRRSAGRRWPLIDALELDPWINWTRQDRTRSVVSAADRREAPCSREAREPMAGTHISEISLDSPQETETLVPVGVVFTGRLVTYFLAHGHIPSPGCVEWEV